MKPPIPVPGLVIRYNYLWDQEKEEGRTAGRKDRPCAIILYHSKSQDTIVVPITHSPPEPGEEELSIEVPAELRRQLGLDDEISWVRMSEVNRFVWPGIHLRSLPSDPSRFDYGMIPQEFYEEIRARLYQAMMRGRIPSTRR
ncbi:hypothetical protein [Rhizobium sp. SGZ-381]|uniref:hypothetical protein n=1 Tax=Rhizobium sp. SGZ-381 TaxID=3342800 RepID=UPI00366ACA8F